MKIVKLTLTVLISVFLVVSTAGSAFAGANIAVSFNTTSAKVGEQVMMTVTVANTGPGDLNGVNVSASLPAGLKFMTSATGTSKNQYNSSTGLWQVDNLKMSSQGAGKKTLNVTAEILPEASGRILTATAVFLSVSNSSGELPLKSAQSQLTIESNKINNGENTGNTGSTSSSTTSTSVTTTPVSKTSLVAAKLKDNNNNNSTNPLNLPQDNPGKAYVASNSTENSNTNVPMSTYALVALGGIGIVIVVGYYLGTRKKI
jgi:uncharacterized repeat protein (TIGR01451 family)